MRVPLLRIFLFFIANSYVTILAQEIPVSFSESIWDAQWITPSNTKATGYGVYLFRKPFYLETRPSSFPIYLSADNQYELYVNDNLVGRGPTKGDKEHWYFEQLDLAPYVRAGNNIVAVKVWNGGPYRPENQRSYKTGLIMQGADTVAAIVNTDRSWKYIQDHSYAAIPVNAPGKKKNSIKLPGYFVAGPGEHVDMSKKIVGWAALSFKDDAWPHAKTLVHGIPINYPDVDSDNSWRLLPSPLPAMELTKQKFHEVRQVTGITVPSKFLEGQDSLVIPPHTKATILLDQNYLTNAFPILSFSKGNKGTINITYAESLYNDKKHKGDRNLVRNKFMLGRVDKVTSGGGEKQFFRPLTYRTFRYVALEIDTKKEPLFIHSFSSTAVGYPLQQISTLETQIPEMHRIVDIGWRTARLCAMDTYMDCPFWEQLQYIGDTRIQAMVTLYNSGDERLVKHALDLMDFSIQPDGITLSRYPTINKQIITPFSLWYIGMLRDYMMYGTDREFIQHKLEGTRHILHYFERFQRNNGSLKDLPGWTFTDWVDHWESGIPPTGSHGESAILDLQLLLAYQNAKQLEEEHGTPAQAAFYQKKIELLSNTVKTLYWDDVQQLFADTSAKQIFSQHANALAILTGLVTGPQLNVLGKKILYNQKLTQASIYFKYYVHQALVMAGLGDDYLNWLDIWRNHMDMGLTTWAEDTNADTTRSDCHAWGSSPNIEFYRTILGIDSASPHFKTVKIEPHLGKISSISGSMPHPNGTISVQYDLTEKPMAIINLPKNCSGTFVWKEKITALEPGVTLVKL